MRTRGPDALLRGPVFPGKARRDTATVTQMGRRYDAEEMPERTEACRARPSRAAARLGLR